jgi:integrase/recombinase XerD
MFRPVNKGDRVAGERMTAQAVFNTVKAYAAAIGLDHFAPHDLRRSYAKLAHKGRAPFEQIQLSLGHASLQTTERIWESSRTLPTHPAATWVENS